MTNSEVLKQQDNSDLVWDMDHISKRDFAERFIRLFENRLCVYSESVEQIYTNYNLHFPTEQGRKMVVLPNPYAFHDTLHSIRTAAIRKTGLCIMPGELLGKQGLVLAAHLGKGQPAPKFMPFKQAIARIISDQRKIGDAFLPILMKGDLREFDEQMPYLHMHRLQLENLPHLSVFERQDIQQTLTKKLLMLYRMADTLKVG
ncbi:hypothetical protein SAMN05216214_11432 [Atopomonas hussainii]|uniref:Uncharacterized protein n=1 Tax=Atopomonas hussainii TaxID=1429083 RepID=A0A1H7R794_9GAMM|nr:hypothetical protein [Atopomonas hussainii]SEL55992.1 hypothetical protein SAMN05216214_11432 [Atopomonas hussainii]